MHIQTLSFVLLGFGVVLIALAAVLRRNHRSQRADRGGVVVGGDNKGIVNTGTMGGSTPGWERWLTVAGSICSLIGLVGFLL